MKFRFQKGAQDCPPLDCTREGEKVQHQSMVKEFQDSEQTSVYHHELLKKMLKRTAILKLQTELVFSWVILLVPLLALTAATVNSS